MQTDQSPSSEAVALQEALTKLATKQPGYGMSYSSNGIQGCAEIRLYGKRAEAAHWLMEHGLGAILALLTPATQQPVAGEVKAHTYRKIATITASQWWKMGDHPAVREYDDIDGSGQAVPWIDTLEGGHIVTPGDWIATGVKGEHWPIKPDVFAATYVRTEPDDQSWPDCLDPNASHNRRRFERDHLTPAVREIMRPGGRPTFVPDAQDNNETALSLNGEAPEIGGNRGVSTEPLAQDTGFAMVGATPVDAAGLQGGVMGKPHRVQLSRKKGWRMPENTVNVARPGPLGNPFVVNEHGTRAECVRLYRLMLGGYLCLSNGPSIAAQQSAVEAVRGRLSDLRGKNLACWCREDGKPCHADVLLELANADPKP